MDEVKPAVGSRSGILSSEETSTDSSLRAAWIQALSGRLLGHQARRGCSRGQVSAPTFRNRRTGEPGLLTYDPFSLSVAQTRA
ncbi:hypothetical protein DPEC_G00172050 [Dallia pectoralis]|uniref:Uncharacterized protein n=1 Tax=Dallia pectoralis TaxID=75939 RepID=A0ACC2GDW2_DALPE|nr:hypothetical protein DPEC_G00172050 [Dallia pectoralis]